MTFREKLEKERPNDFMNGSPRGCPDDYGYTEHITEKECDQFVLCGECWDREMPETADEKWLKGTYEKPEIRHIPPKPPTIKDSGERTNFDTGVVRDIQKGKGRCDLMPLDVAAKFYEDDKNISRIFEEFEFFKEDGKLFRLGTILSLFRGYHNIDMPTLLLEVSKHFEDGAEKYGENNWQKGIPVKCYINSAVRHYLKHLRGDNDEPHDRAFVWNIMCCIWTCIHKPELNEYGKTPDPKGV